MCRKTCWRGITTCRTDGIDTSATGTGIHAASPPKRGYEPPLGSSRANGGRGTNVPKPSCRKCSSPAPATHRAFPAAGESQEGARQKGSLARQTVQNVSSPLLSDDSLGMDRACRRSTAVETHEKGKQTSRVEAPLGVGPVARAPDRRALPRGNCKESKSSRF